MAKKYNSGLTAAEELLNKPIAYHAILAKTFNSLPMAVMIGQGMYWQNIAKKAKKEWFYETSDEWYNQTGLTKEQQITARKKMVGFYFWEEKLMGNPAKMHYRINVKTLLLLIDKFIETGIPVITDKRSQLRENTRTSSGKFRQQVAVNHGNSDAVNYGNYNTEIKKTYSESEPNNQPTAPPLKEAEHTTQKQNVPPPPAAPKFPAAWSELLSKAAKKPATKMKYSSERVYEVETPEEIATALMVCGSDQLFLDNFKRIAGLRPEDQVFDIFTAFLERRLIDGGTGYQTVKRFREHLLSFPGKYLYVKKAQQQEQKPQPKINNAVPVYR